jgi:hypothetical protein
LDISTYSKTGTMFFQIHTFLPFCHLATIDCPTVGGHIGVNPGAVQPHIRFHAIETRLEKNAFWNEKFSLKASKHGTM